MVILLVATAGWYSFRGPRHHFVSRVIRKTITSEKVAVAHTKPDSRVPAAAEEDELKQMQVEIEEMRAEQS